MDLDLMLHAQRSRRAGHSMWSSHTRSYASPQTTKPTVTSTNPPAAIEREPAAN